MEKLTHFTQPVDLGELPLSLDQVCYYLYFPVSAPGRGIVLDEHRLSPLYPLLMKVFKDEPKRCAEEYVYLTVKKMYVGGGVTANRPGWHCDGFLSDDLNYVWFDSAPTVFNSGSFSITPDHVLSLAEFDGQAAAKDNYHGPCNHLLKLDSTVIHRVNTDIPEQIMRTFIKVTVSKNRFNLKDNSKNHLLPLAGPLYDRALVRNDPHQAQADTYTPPVDDHFK